MWERPDDLHDPFLAERLAEAIGEPPPRLQERLEALARIGRAPRAMRRKLPLWVVLGPQLTGLSLLLALLAGFVQPFATWCAASSTRGQGPVALIAGLSMVIPIALLLGLEVVRGAPRAHRRAR